MRVVSFGLVLLLALSINAFADEPPDEAKKPIGKVWFTEPKDGAKVKNPVKFCFGSSENLKVVEWKRENVTGEGHHHLLIDQDYPKYANYKGIKKPIIMFHYNKGEPCKTMSRKPLSLGKHVIRGMFTENNHAPYLPLIGDLITIEVVE